MRWFWIDRFTEFVRGKRASAIKNITLSDEVLDEYYPGYSHYPHSLIIEGMAQTGGLLVSEITEFRQKVVLAKVSKAQFHHFVQQGDQLRIEVVLDDVQPNGAFAQARAYLGERLQAEVELCFAFLDSRFGDKPHFSPEFLLRWLQSLKLYEIGVDENGVRLKPPSYLLEAECAAAESN